MTMHSNSFNAYIGDGTVLDRAIDEGADSITSVRERPMALITFKPEPTERKRKKGLGDNPINVGYCREARLKAAPDRDAFLADKQSKWSRVVSCDERRKAPR